MKKPTYGQSTRFQALKHFDDLLTGVITLDEYRRTSSAPVVEPLTTIVTISQRDFQQLKNQGAKYTLLKTFPDGVVELEVEDTLISGQEAPEEDTPPNVPGSQPPNV